MAHNKNSRSKKNQWCSSGDVSPEQNPMLCLQPKTWRYKLLLWDVEWKKYSSRLCWFSACLELSLSDMVLHYMVLQPCMSICPYGSGTYSKALPVRFGTMPNFNPKRPAALSQPDSKQAASSKASGLKSAAARKQEARVANAAKIRHRLSALPRPKKRMQRLVKSWIARCCGRLAGAPVRQLAVVVYITYGPRKAVAEVSNHNEPIGRKSGIQLVRKPMDFTLSCFVLNRLTD